MRLVFNWWLELRLLFYMTLFIRSSHHNKVVNSGQLLGKENSRLPYSLTRTGRLELTLVLFMKRAYSRNDWLTYQTKAMFTIRGYGTFAVC